MALPQPTALPTTTDFVITKSDASTYTLPIGFRPNQFSLGQPVDKVGRVVGSTKWIRYGANALEPEPFILYGQLKGANAYTKLDEVQVAAKDGIKFNSGYIEYDIDGGDVEAHEKSRDLIEVTLILFPKKKGDAI